MRERKKERGGGREKETCLLSKKMLPPGVESIVKKSRAIDDTTFLQNLQSRLCIAIFPFITQTEIKRLLLYVNKKTLAIDRLKLVVVKT